MTIVETLVSTDDEQAAARSSCRLLGRLCTMELHLRSPEQDKVVLVPTRVAQMFADILTQLAQGKAVTIVPIEAMLTTQDAAFSERFPTILDRAIEQTQCADSQGGQSAQDSFW
jgi:hypothetical protein